LHLGGLRWGASAAVLGSGSKSTSAGIARRERVKKLLAVSSVVGLMSFFGAVTVSADYNPPPAVQAVCDAGHGAFGAFSPYAGGTPSNPVTGQPPYFGDSVLGSARNGVTGAVNSNYSAFCNL